MKKFLIIGGAVLLIALGLFFALKPPVDSVTLNPIRDEVAPSTPTIKQSSSSSNSNTPTLSHSSVSLSFDFGNGEKKFSTFNVETPTDSVGATFKEGESLLELIQKTDLQIETENFPPLGKMVTSINGFKNGTDGKYWQYWINGKYAQIGVSAYKPKPSDSIEWRFTKDKIE